MKGVIAIEGACCGKNAVFSREAVQRMDGQRVPVIDHQGNRYPGIVRVREREDGRLEAVFMTIDPPPRKRQ